MCTLFTSVGSLEYVEQCRVQCVVLCGSVQSVVCSVQCVVCIVQCAVCSAQCIGEECDL